MINAATPENESCTREICPRYPESTTKLSMSIAVRIEVENAKPHRALNPAKRKSPGSPNAVIAPRGTKTMTYHPTRFG